MKKERIVSNLIPDERLERSSSGTMHGLIDRAKSEAKIAERERLGHIFAEWEANGLLSDVSVGDRQMMRDLFATDY